MEFRKAREADLERLVEIHLAAYPDDRNAEARQRNLTHNIFGPLDDLIVAVDRGGELLGHAFLFRLRTSFGGVAVKMGGIASVAIAPEARGRGIGSALMDHLHVLSDTRGDALTMLYAFRQGYYTRLGYAPASSRKRLAFDPRSVPDSWRALARGGRIRNARGSDGAGIRNVHARAAVRSSGWTTRTKTFWERFFSREQRILLVCDSAEATTTSSAAPTTKRKAKGGGGGGAAAAPPPSSRRGGPRAPIAGYVAFSLVQEHPHAETTIAVDELIADDDETRRALFGALSAMRDQAKEIQIEIAEDDPLERALIDPDGHRHGSEAVEHGLGDIVGGPMIRIEDIPRSLAARGYGGNGAFDVVVRSSSEADKEDIIAVGVRVREGRAEVGPARGGGALHTNRAGLAAIFYGGLSVSRAVALGLADADPRIASRIDAIVRMPPLTPIDAF